MNNKTSITFRIDNEFVSQLKENKSEHLREIFNKHFYNKIKCSKCGLYCYESRIINNICIICNDDIKLKSKKNTTQLTDEQVKKYFSEMMHYKKIKTKSCLSVYEWAQINVPISYRRLMVRAKSLKLY